MKKKKMILAALAASMLFSASSAMLTVNAESEMTETTETATELAKIKSYSFEGTTLTAKDNHILPVWTTDKTKDVVTITFDIPAGVELVDTTGEKISNPLQAKVGSFHTILVQYQGQETGLKTGYLLNVSYAPTAYIHAFELSETNISSAELDSTISITFPEERLELMSSVEDTKFAELQKIFGMTLSEKRDALTAAYPNTDLSSIDERDIKICAVPALNVEKKEDKAGIYTVDIKPELRVYISTDTLKNQKEPKSYLLKEPIPIKQLGSNQKANLEINLPDGSVKDHYPWACITHTREDGGTDKYITILDNDNIVRFDVDSFSPFTYTEATAEDLAITGLTVNGKSQSLNGSNKYEVTPGNITFTMPDGVVAVVSGKSYKSGEPISVSAGQTITVITQSEAANVNGENFQGITYTLTGKNDTTSSGGGASAVKKQVMYRVYNPNSGEHFYTANEAEKNTLISIGWKDEGEGWMAPATSKTPVYRVYNPNAGDHHYTTDKNEKDTLVSLGWKDEGIGWYSDDKQGLALYRLYNPNAESGAHHYTVNGAERDYLASVGWKTEGVSWYGLK